MGQEGRILPSFIRRILPEDIPAVVAIEKQSNPGPWGVDQFQAELDNPCAAVHLLTVQDEIAAFVCSWKILDELQIQNVATAPCFRRKGYADRLLRHVVQQAVADGATRVFLEVRAGNRAARQLYEKMGFSSSGSRHNYYADGEDALLMKLELD